MSKSRAQSTVSIFLGLLILCLFVVACNGKTSQLETKPQEPADIASEYVKALADKNKKNLELLLNDNCSSVYIEQQRVMIFGTNSVKVVEVLDVQEVSLSPAIQMRRDIYAEEITQEKLFRISAQEINKGRNFFLVYIFVGCVDNQEWEVIPFLSGSIENLNNFTNEMFSDK